MVNNIKTTLHEVKVNTTEKSIQFHQKTHYIDIDTHSLPCLGQLVCHSGITIKLEIKFHKLEENTIIFTTGAHTPSNVGVAIVYRYGQIHFIVSSNTLSWYVSINRDQIIFHQYHTLILSWSTTHGLQAIFNTLIVDGSNTPIAHSSINTTLGHAYLGSTPNCGCNTDVSFSIKSLTIYYAWIQICVDGGLLPPVHPGKLILPYLCFLNVCPFPFIT